VGSSRRFEPIRRAANTACRSGVAKARSILKRHFRADLAY
jgi:hypothetical protein